MSIRLEVTGISHSALFPLTLKTSLDTNLVNIFNFRLSMSIISWRICLWNFKSQIHISILQNNIFFLIVMILEHFFEHYTGKLNVILEVTGISHSALFPLTLKTSLDTNLVNIFNFRLSISIISWRICLWNFKSQIHISILQNNIFFNCNDLGTLFWILYWKIERSTRISLSSQCSLSDTLLKQDSK